MKRRSLSLLCCVLLPAALWAQEPKPTSTPTGLAANRLLEQGDSLLALGLLEDGCRLFERSLPLYEQVYGQGRAQNAQALKGIAQRLLAREFPARGLEYATRALRLLEAQPTPNPLLIGDMYAFLGRIYQSQDLGEAAFAQYEQAIGKFEHSSDKEGLRQAIPLYLLLGNTYRAGGDFGMAAGQYRKAAQAITQIDSEYRPDMASICVQLGEMLMKTGAYQLAELELERALRISRKVFGAQSAEVADRQQWLCSLRLQQGRFADAHAHALDAYRLLGPQGNEQRAQWVAFAAREFFGHQQYAQAVHWTGLQYSLPPKPSLEEVLACGKSLQQEADQYRMVQALPQAEILLRQAEGYYLDALGAESLPLAGLLDERRQLAMQQRQWGKALELQQRIADMRQRLLPEDRDQFFADQLEEALLLEKGGQEDAAARRYRQLLEQIPQQTVRWRALALNNLAMLYLQQRQYALALDFAQQLYDYYRQQFGPQYVKTVATRLLLGNILHAKGETLLAMEQYRLAEQQQPRLFTFENPVALQACRHLAEGYGQRGESGKARYYRQLADHLTAKLQEAVDIP